MNTRTIGTTMPNYNLGGSEVRSIIRYLDQAIQASELEARAKACGESLWAGIQRQERHVAIESMRDSIVNVLTYRHGYLQQAAEELTEEITRELALASMRDLHQVKDRLEAIGKLV